MTYTNHAESGVSGALTYKLRLCSIAATTYQATLKMVRMCQSMIKANERAPGPAMGSATSTPVTLSTTRPASWVVMRCAQVPRGSPKPEPRPCSGAKRAGARSCRRVEPCAESLFLGCELLGLVFLLEGIEQLIELAIHHFLQLVQREVDPVIGDTSLREVIR